MLRYTLKRLLYGILVLLGVVTLVFFLFNILPGDPARMMLGERADAESIEIINRDLGRDKPVGLQYINYLNDLLPISLHNNLDPDNYFFLDEDKYAPYTTLLKAGSTSVVLKAPYLRRSYQSKRKVSDIIATAFPQTALLAVVALSFALVLGVLLGILSALYKDTWIDRITLVLSTLGMSLPSFFAAILIAWLFAYVLSDWTHLNMFGNLYTVDDYGTGEYLDLKNLILPALTLGIRPLATLTQLTKNSMLEVLSQDYIRTARCGIRLRLERHGHRHRRRVGQVRLPCRHGLHTLHLCPAHRHQHPHRHPLRPARPPGQDAIAVSILHTLSNNRGNDVPFSITIPFFSLIFPFVKRKQKGKRANNERINDDA